MSGAMEKLTAALEANTAIQEKVLAALKQAGGAGGAKPADKPAPGKAEATKPAGGKPAGGKPKGKTVDDIAAAFGGYLGIKDKDEREVRKGNVKSINDYFGVAKATDLDPENFEEALGYLQQYIDGETPDFSGSGGGEEEDEGALV